MKSFPSDALRAPRAVPHFLFLLGCCALATAGPAPRVQAATFTVTTDADTTINAPVNGTPVNGVCDAPGTGDGCTLREAIGAANAAAGDDSIVFDATAFGTMRKRVALNGGQLPTITGPGKLSISAPVLGVSVSGEQNSRVFRVGSGANVTMTGLSVFQGNLTGTTDNMGAGIWNQGTLLLEGCTLNSNRASGNGGAIYSAPVNSATTALLTLRNCTVEGNVSGPLGGGGIYNGNGRLLLESCTLANNIANNSSDAHGLASLGNAFTTTEVRNTIVAANFNGDVAVVGGATNSIVSLGFNMVGTSTPAGTFSAANNDKVIGPGPGSGTSGNPAAGLDFLNSYGGPTNTVRIFESSPAFNAGDTALAVDQRGILRPQGAQDDIGAFEIKPNLAPVVDLNGTGAGINNTASQIEGSGNVSRPLLAPLAAISDEGPNSNSTTGSIFRLTIKITNLQDAAAESLVAGTGTSGTNISSSGYDPATGELVLSRGDTTENYAKALRTIRYSNTSQSPNTTPRIISVVALDLDGASSVVATTTVSVTAVNDAPIALVPEDDNFNPITQTIAEDTPLTFSTTNGNLVGVGDFDEAGQVEEVQISVLRGTLSLKQLTGLTFSQGDGTGDRAMTFRGTVTIENDAQGFPSTPGGDVGRALDGLIYTPDPNYNGADTLSISIDDLGNTGTGGPLSASAALPISVTPVNDAPINSLPATAATERNVNLVFSTSNGRRISLSDPDAGNSNLTVTLTAEQGRITLGSVPTGVTVTGNGTSSVTAVGTLSNLNLALEGLIFAPNANYVGNDASLTVFTRDSAIGGNGALSDTDTLAIRVVESFGPVASSGVLISEFRFHGTTSADEYVEIFNTTSAPLNISGWKIRTNTGSGSSPTFETATVPAGTLLPARGHFLFSGVGYTLGSYARGDANIGSDAANDSGVVLLNADSVQQDAVGFASSEASLRENGALSSAPNLNSPATSQHAFMRDFAGSGLKDTGNSASDFVLVSTNGTAVAGDAGAIPAQLGAPNPESLSSPVNVNSQVAITLLQPEAGLNNAPNRLRTGSGNGGTLLLRRTIRNTGSQPLSRVRLLMTRITSQGSPTGIVPGTQADVRLISSGNESIALPNRDTNGVIIPAGQDGAGTTLTPVYAALLEAPSNATSTSGTPVVTGGGGGLGSSVVFDLTFPTPLLPNTSANYGFNLQVATGGTYLVAFNILAVTQAPAN